MNDTRYHIKNVYGDFNAAVWSHLRNEEIGTRKNSVAQMTISLLGGVAILISTMSTTGGMETPITPLGASSFRRGASWRDS